MEIAECSGAEHFNGNHCSVADDRMSVTFWADDERRLEFSWSPDGTYQGGRRIQGSGDFDDCMLLIYRDSQGNIGVSLNKY